ncbi:[FeFe] hydrogenase H-cluster maturation GTPase HydF (plasmid) [Entomospira nematocerorum]|uniref:[FeFe] hydrogenase H-cluster maturation GTPase HydF n=1 Tax=Entomospira nematocerorum TaxID=2719987 RepID=A0A968GDV0_9SPIO|nr:[FeFe] hydrogenase H-cluster maturation GTPase HydF [Entomospira nematocera]NIZ47678.1 [FeFe] hydrogenase H-cluster maturation GTPase HydF [Entomospira nematocera]WDI34570.1 [FeFe] hydrogenase H-cluster maturation GTPase HydF [Entomospira nematocera]
MSSSPIPALIPNIVLMGHVNAGKSTLLNALIGQEVAITSPIAGTTTDTVHKRMEIIGVGAVNLLDTAGLGDTTSLGVQRLQKTLQSINQAHLLLYVLDASCWYLHRPLKQSALPADATRRIMVFTHIDQLTVDQRVALQQNFPDALLMDYQDPQSIDALLRRIAHRLQREEKLLLDGIALPHRHIVHVIPIDSEAPKGRLIMPQMQLLREALDRHLRSTVVQVEELQTLLDHDPTIDLIITDSQAFAQVSAINQQRYPLTSYSILQANQKGDLAFFLQGVQALATLPPQSNILMMESCTHNVNHEDIGRVKIPKLLQKQFPHITFHFDFVMGAHMPDNLQQYDAIIHCGSCMLPAKTMHHRMDQARRQQVPMLNYGLFLAYAMGILEEATAVYRSAPLI